MGNNQAYTDWEATVIAAYDEGVLTPALLSKFMDIHRDSDIDSGGKVGTLSKDGLDCEEITLKVFGVEIPKQPDLPKNHKTWTPEQERLNEEYWEKRYDLFSEISNRFGWH